MYLVTPIVTFSEPSKATGKAGWIPREPRLAANESGGSESYDRSDEVHWNIRYFPFDGSREPHVGTI